VEFGATVSWTSTVLGTAGRILVVALFWWDAIFLLIPDFPGTVGFISQRGLPFPEFLAVAAIVMLLVLPALVFFKKTEALGFIGLSMFCIVTAIVFHQYWKLDGADRVMEQIHFMKNLAIAGALLMLFDHCARRSVR
jgi:putative oxidoreductase